MRFPLAGTPLGRRFSSASVGCRGGKAAQVRQWPLASRNSQLHFQHCISAAKVATMHASALPLPLPLALP